MNGNILIIDDDFMIQGSSSLEISDKRKNRNFDFDTYLNGTMDKSQIQSALKKYNQIWYDSSVTEDYKNELLESLEFVYKNHTPEFLYYFTLFCSNCHLFYIFRCNPFRNFHSINCSRCNASCVSCTFATWKQALNI